MCNKCDGEHKPQTTEQLATIWADIKATQKALNARRSFLEGLGLDLASRTADSQYIKLSGLLTGLWERFRVL